MTLPNETTQKTLADDWYYSDGSKIHGPLSSRQLEDQAVCGQVRRDYPVKKGNDGHWHLASQITGLVFAPAPHANVGIAEVNASTPPLPAHHEPATHPIVNPDHAASSADGEKAEVEPPLADPALIITCPECGERIMHTVKVCPGCGCPLEQPAETSSFPPIAEQPSSQGSKPSAQPLVPSWGVWQIVVVFGFLIPLVLGLLVSLLGFRSWSPVPGGLTAIALVWVNRRALRLRDFGWWVEACAGIGGGMFIWLILGTCTELFACWWAVGAGLVVLIWVGWLASDSVTQPGRKLPDPAVLMPYLANTWPVWLAAVAAVLIGLPLADKPAWWYQRSGDACFEKKEWDAAIEQYTEAIRVRPDYHDAYFKRGLCYRNKSELALAASDLAMCMLGDLDEYPIYGQVFSDAKSESYKANDYQLPIAVWTEAVKLRPTSDNWREQLAVAHYHRSVSLYNKQKYDEAISDCTLAIQAKPNADYAYHIRGVAYRDKGDLESAIQDLTQAIQLAPKADLLADRGEAYRRSGKLDEAVADCDRAIQTDPNSAFAYQVRGRAYELKGDKSRAEADYAEAKRLGWKE